MTDTKFEEAQHADIVVRLLAAESRLEELLFRVAGLEKREMQREEQAAQMQAQMREMFKKFGPMGLVKQFLMGKPNGEAQQIR